MSLEHESEGGAGGGAKRALKVLAIIVVILGLTVALLPTIASLGPIRRMALKTVNAGIPGTLEIQSWSFGWLKGIRLTNAEFSDEAQGVSARLKSFSMSSGLINLALREKDLGTIEIVEPEVSLTLPAINPYDAGAQGRGTGASDKAPVIAGKAGEKKRTRVAPDVKAVTRITGGRVSVGVAGVESPMVISGLDATLTVKNLNDPLVFELAGAQGDDGKGRFNANGALKVLDKGAFDAKTISGEIAMAADEIDLTPIAPIAKAFAALPDMGGRVSFKLNGNMRDADNLQAAGKVEVNGLKLGGGPLGEDKLAFDKVSLDFDLARTNGSIEVRNLAFAAPFAEATGAGKLDAGQSGRFPTGSIKSKARIYPAVLAAQLPHTLRIKEGAGITGGTILFDGAIDSSPDKLAFECAVKTRDIEAKQGAQTLKLDVPIDILARGYIGDKGPVLESLKLQSSFAEVTGKGTPDDLQVDLSADLEAALKEAGKFLDLGGIAVAGKLTGKVRMTGASESAKDLSANILAQQLTVGGLTPQPVKQESVQADFAGRINLSADGKLRDIEKISMNLNSPIFMGRVNAERLTPAAQGKYPAVAGMSAQAFARLADVAGLCRAAGILKPGLDIAGRLKLDCSGAIEGDVVKLSNVAAKISDLALAQGDKKVAEPEFQAEAQADIDLKQATITLHSLKTVSSLMTISCSGTLTDFNKSRIFDLKGVIECDFSRIGQFISPFLPRPIEIEGKAPRKFSISTSLEETAWDAMLKKTNAEVGLYMDRVKSFGVEAKNLDVKLRVHDARAEVSIDSMVNEGRLLLTPVIDARGEKPVLLIPDNSQVLRDVKLTNEMASELLALIHPIFKGCIVSSGKMGMRLEHCRAPLDKKAYLKETVLNGEVVIADVMLVPAGLLADILGFIKQKADAVAVPAQEISFACVNGRIKPSPLTIKAHEYSITFLGSVGLDGTLDYAAEVPVTEGMVSEEIYKYLKNARVKLLVGGTVAEPRMSSESVRETLASLVKEASKNIIRDQAGDLLKKFLK